MRFLLISYIYKLIKIIILHLNQTWLLVKLELEMMTCPNVLNSHFILHFITPGQVITNQVLS